MAFWRKGNPKRIREELQALVKDSRRIMDLCRRGEHFGLALREVRGLLAQAKDDIAERTRELIACPLIDASYDAQIRELARSEALHLDALDRNLQVYLGLVPELTSPQDIEAAVELVEEETRSIAAREEACEELLKGMVVATRRERLRHGTDQPPPKKTNDGVPWSHIGSVARSLGGWVEMRPGLHVCILRFPGCRPIPLSEDLYSRRLAREIKEDIRTAYPSKELDLVPLHEALRSGRDEPLLRGLL